MNNKIIVFAGPSGSGKDTILKEILHSSKNNIKLTTATTREPREGEIEGVDYYFLTRAQFLQYVEDGLISEYNKHAGNLYGTYLPDLEKKLQEGKNIIVQVQLKGAQFLQKKYGAILFFVHADSFEILEERIRSRSSLSDEEITKRIEIAKREVLEESLQYDHQVINKQNDLDATVKLVLKILKEEGADL